MNKKLKITLALGVATLLFTGCGGGSSGSDSDTQTGIFVDAPVYGLYYKTATQEGYTNENGEFSYKAGETIEFKLGNLSLGSVSAGGVITPYTIAGDTNTSNPSVKAQNIAMLLQNFDANRTSTDQLDVSKLKNYDFSDVNLSVATATMETKINTLFSTGTLPTLIDLTHPLINATTAQNVLKNYVDNYTDKTKLTVKSVEIKF
jgi:ABC-type glycerol-3-phosphate transport system substrate-binding protein